ncbi:MAG: hypothetical protein P8181_02125 [bacterium]
MTTRQHATVHRRGLLLGAVALVLAVIAVSDAIPGGGYASPRSRKAAEIINRHIEALGGIENIKALKTLEIHGRLQRQGLEFPFTLWMRRPNLSRMDIDVRGRTFVQAYDGKTAWWVNPLLGAVEPREMPEEFARSTLRWVDFEGPLVDYRKKRNEVEYLGEVDTENGRAHEIELIRSDGDVWHVFIDTGTYLEVKRTYEETFQGETREVVAYFYDYADVEGDNLYHKIDGEAIDGARYTMVFDTVNPNAAVEDAWFGMPESE